MLQGSQRTHPRDRVLALLMPDPVPVRQRGQKQERKTAEESSLLPHLYLLFMRRGIDSFPPSDKQKMWVVQRTLLSTGRQLEPYCFRGIRTLHIYRAGEERRQ